MATSPSLHEQVELSPKLVKLLRLLWEAKDRSFGLSIFSLPAELRDEAFLILCVSEGFIELGEHDFCGNTGEEFWATDSFGDKYPYSAFFRDAEAGITKGVRLGARGEAAICRMLHGSEVPAQAEPRPQGEETGASENCPQRGGPMVNHTDDRCALWMGKRIYLGRDTQMSRLFWLLAKPVGCAHPWYEAYAAVDGIAGIDWIGWTNVSQEEEEYVKGQQRFRKALSRLRRAMRRARLDDHFLIHRGGSLGEPEYSMIPRFAS